MKGDLQEGQRVLSSDRNHHLCWMSPAYLQAILTITLGLCLGHSLVGGDGEGRCSSPEISAVLPRHLQVIRP